MLVIAQTNLQLYNELAQQGRSVAELVQTRIAYECAMELFSAQYRASGKPFLAHLVGTASLLARMQQPISVVTAGLVHAAFEFGDFGDGAAGLTVARQRRLTFTIGREASDLVTSYYRQSRNQAMARMRAGELSACTALEQAVLLIHLADTVEEYADGGVRYAPGKEQFYQQACDAGVASEIVAAARQLGLDSIAAEFTAAFAAAHGCSPPPQLITQRRGSYVLLPASYQERPYIRWCRFCGSLRRKVSNAMLSVRPLAKTPTAFSKRATT